MSVHVPTPTTPQGRFLTDEPAFRLARKTKRWLAAAVDYTLFLIIVGVITYCLGEPISDAEGNITYTLSGGPGFLVIVLAWFILLPLIEMLNDGQTIGKVIFKVRAATMGNQIRLFCRFSSSFV
ncbi:RDD family protein [Paraflavitalea speifideaquila]|uniref:RDD family protein n=1 Tax=Paraflavitalea speifideaquila TaxID=3076558 RepID=UPI0028EA7577|nr:RDD family protein [Paraflavitalea speifideiaquila]